MPIICCFFLDIIASYGHSTVFIKLHQREARAMAMDLDHSVCEELSSLVDSLTHSGNPSLDQDTVKKLKKICKSVNGILSLFVVLKARVGWLFVFYVTSTARSFRDDTPIYCPLRRT